MSRLNLRSLKAEIARRNFSEFVAHAWPVLEPQIPFVSGIHVEAICSHLQAVTEGKIRNLIINVPPGHAKSLLTAVFWPAWVWIDHPETRWLFSSYSAVLAVRDSVKCRRLIESDWYQERWGDRFTLTSDQNQKQRYENDRTGYRIATSVGGSATGERADIVVVDDPHSVGQSESDLERRAAVEWWNGTMATRLNDFATGHKVVIQQRLHEADLTGDLLVRGGYELLCLPAEFEPDRASVTAIGWRDPRTKAGQLLWAEKVTAVDLAELKTTLGSYRYAGQYQQRPSPAGGGIFQRHWWRYWHPPNTAPPAVEVRMPDGEIRHIRSVIQPQTQQQIVQSWDLTFKGETTSDYVVGQVWGATGADRYLLDQRRGKWSFPETREQIRILSLEWPQTQAILVEDKANGSAIVAELQHSIGRMVPVNPEGGKLVRAHAVCAQVEAGNVYVPHPATAPWVEDFIEEATIFPAGRHDDQVDCLTQALRRVQGVAPGVLYLDPRRGCLSPVPVEYRISAL
jgi:predicted phage terminase large subunit-like protein